MVQSPVMIVMTRRSSAIANDARRRRLIGAAFLAAAVAGWCSHARAAPPPVAQPRWLLRAGNLEVGERSLLYALGVKGKVRTEAERVAAAGEHLGRLRSRLILAVAAERRGYASDVAVTGPLERFSRQHLVDQYITETVDARARELAGGSKNRFRFERDRLFKAATARARKEFPGTVDAAAVAAVARGEAGDQVVARVAGGEIRAEELRRGMRAVDHPGDKRETAERLAQTVLDSIVVRRGMTVIAEQEGFAGREDFRDEVADRRLRLLADLYTERDVYPSIPALSPAGVAAYYERNRERLKRGEEREIFEILVPDEETARAVAARLAAGAPFADEVRANSIGATKGDEGRLGLLQAGEAYPALDSEIRKLAAGDVSPPVRTPFGWHILRCARVVTGRVPPLAEVRPAVEAAIVEEQRAAAVRERVSLLEREIQVTVNESRVQEILKGQGKK